MAIIGYIRVSSNKQTLTHQHFEIERFAKANHLHVDHWIEEKISSRKPLHMRKLGELLEQVQSGDTLIACEISRLGRSLLEVMRILETCLNKNCRVWTIKESYRLGNDIQSKVMAFSFSIAAEIERDLISQRTKASLDNLKSAGIKLGRPFGAESRKLKLSDNAAKVKALLEQGFSRRKTAALMGVQAATLRRFIKRMGWQFDNQPPVLTPSKSAANANAS